MNPSFAWKEKKTDDVIKEHHLPMNEINIPSSLETNDIIGNEGGELKERLLREWTLDSWRP